MEISPTCRTLEEFYHIDGHTFEKRYKEVLCEYRKWEQLEHADEWILFSGNIGPHLAIDETSLSNGELYTIVTNRDACTRECSLVAVVAGSKLEDVIAVPRRIDRECRYAVKEVTLDLSDSMHRIVRTVFPKASRVIDRFHFQKLVCDAVQELYASNTTGMPYSRPTRMWRKPNRMTRTMFLAGIPTVIPVRNCLYNPGICYSNQPTNGQKQTAAILFEEYPDIQTVYGLYYSQRMIFSKNTIKDTARLAMARWYNKVEEVGLHTFNVIAATFYEPL